VHRLSPDIDNHEARNQEFKLLPINDRPAAVYPVKHEYHKDDDRGQKLEELLTLCIYITFFEHVLMK
jgi:hypothetical protein